MENKESNSHWRPPTALAPPSPPVSRRFERHGHGSRRDSTDCGGIRSIHARQQLDCGEIRLVDVALQQLSPTPYLAGRLSASTPREIYGVVPGCPASSTPYLASRPFASTPCEMYGASSVIVGCPAGSTPYVVSSVVRDDSCLLPVPQPSAESMALAAALLGITPTKPSAEPSLEATNCSGMSKEGNDF